ncbi:hypothetical protein WJ0W_000427 [Paenibacillus melissococcoides]|uniref:Uncharacterized protein n=1 Tax=Paenibacillus melissococcoides TaxID=2912268 RepID=A0ABM9FVL2_9BACL|nr:hypothetical protein WJ0W_000427 [Paenibacillus melissococcoides]
MRQVHCLVETRQDNLGKSLQPSRHNNANAEAMGDPAACSRLGRCPAACCCRAASRSPK